MGLKKAGFDKTKTENQTNQEELNARSNLDFFAVPGLKQTFK